MQDKTDKPPAPTDLELMDLPAGLCRRYQQGKCHKGRSCKWKHEYCSWVHMPSALSDDSAPSASLDHRKGMACSYAPPSVASAARELARGLLSSPQLALKMRTLEAVHRQARATPCAARRSRAWRTSTRRRGEAGA